MPLWLADQPLILASKSSARRAMLVAAGIPVQIEPADIDERALERNAPDTAEAVARMLAREKVHAVASRLPERLIVGADQILALGERRFSKPANRAAAQAQLKELRGRTHELHSAAVLVQDGTVRFEYSDTARLTMRSFSDSFLDAYLDAAGTTVMDSVGAYQLERSGIQLFERVEGDYFTILGMPLLPLLVFLRSAGLLAA